jgi:hypothetical protein
MTCAEFEASFDRFVDDMLEPSMAEACCRHISKCTPCDREVTRWQQTRILLSTAVADFASAVDVSSVRDDVFAALGMADDGGAARRQSATREAAYERSGDAQRRGGRKAGRNAASPRRGAFAGILRFTSAATVSAVTAAAAVLLLTPTPTMVTGDPPTSPSHSSHSLFRQVATGRLLPWAKDPLSDVAPVAYTLPPYAQPETSHVEGLEAAPGRTASTWVQPRTNARVIWVEDRGMAGLGK